MAAAYENNNSKMKSIAIKRSAFCILYFFPKIILDFDLEKIKLPTDMPAAFLT